ncbi:MAG: hypothetical protein BWK80_36700 [Desulfobacteraceae bacterium IS3]|nr:MAG: hypothetical protein BWK80_36700 [Desulfobacteraceae bacterium IS3]
MNFRAVMCRPYATYICPVRGHPITARQFIAGNLCCLSERKGINEALNEAVSEALNMITENDCKGWF